MRSIVCMLSLLMLLSLLGCAPRVEKIPTFHAKLVDSDLGFYAYTNPLRSNPVDSVFVVIADFERVTGCRTVNTPDPQELCPSEGFSPSLIIVRPNELSDLVPYAQTSIPDGESFVVLGYFVDQLVHSEVPDLFVKNVQESRVDGLKWGSASNRIREDVLEIVPKMIEFTAEFGADAILDLAVVYSGGHYPYGDAGVYLVGKAVAKNEGGAPGIHTIQQALIFSP